MPAYEIPPAWPGDIYFAAAKEKDSGEEKFLIDAQRLYEKALRQADTSKETGEGQHLITHIEGQNGDYGQGVLLDTDIFDDINPRKWGKVLSNFVYNKISGTELTMYDANGNPETVYFARKNDRVRKIGAKNDHKVINELARYRGDNIRAVATVHLSEALATSGNETYSNEHNHQWMDEKGWIYRTAYLQDRSGRIYEATLNIANGRDRKILYDITNIRQIDKRKKATGGVVPSTNTGRGSHTSDSFGKSIHRGMQDVKSDHSTAGRDVNGEIDIMPKLYDGQNSMGRSFNQLVQAQRGEIPDIMPKLDPAAKTQQTSQNAAAMQQEVPDIMPKLADIGSQADAADGNPEFEAYMDSLAQDENDLTDPVTPADHIYDAKLRRLQQEEAPPESNSNILLNRIDRALFQP